MLNEVEKFIDQCSAYLHYSIYPAPEKTEDFPLDVKISAIALSILSLGIFLIYSTCFWEDHQVALKPQCGTAAAAGGAVQRYQLENHPTMKYKYAKTPGEVAATNKMEKQLQFAKEQQAKEKIHSFDLKNRWEFEVEAEEKKLAHEVGIAFTEGRRGSMEDADLATEFMLRNRTKVQLYGVFDGHGGPKASMYLKEQLQPMLLAELNRARDLNDETIGNAITAVCVMLSEKMNTDDGTTATFAVILQGKGYVANVGDTRAILVDEKGNTTQLTEDAKPNEMRFRNGVEKRGGSVMLWGGYRVDGEIAVAREIGMQERFTPSQGTVSHVTPRPKIAKFDPSKGCLLMACDGLWDVASSNEIGDEIAAMFENSVTPKNMAEKLTSAAVGNGSRDNVSVMVVKLSSP